MARWDEQVELLATLVELTQQAMRIAYMVGGGNERDAPEIQFVPRPELPGAEKSRGSTKAEIAAFFADLG